MSLRAHGHENNNIKCLLSLSHKTNLIILSANKSPASNMVLILRLSFSWVNTPSLIILSKHTWWHVLTWYSGTRPCLYLTVSVLRKFHPRHCPKPRVCRKHHLIIVSLVILWPPSGHPHNYYRVIVAEINYQRRTNCFILIGVRRPENNWYKFQDLIIPLMNPTIADLGSRWQVGSGLLLTWRGQRADSLTSGPRNI